MPTRELYLDLLKRAVTNTIYQDAPRSGGEPEFDEQARELGMDLPTEAHTMVGRRRLDHVQQCLERVIADGVPGDFVETGVWRGGVGVFARGVLKAAGVTDRRVWMADSFQGFPVARAHSHPLDRHMGLHRLNDAFGVPLDEVRDNFRRYGLLDGQVEFLPGWFRDTLPAAPIERIAVLRLDGDLYESTMDALTHLYPKLSPGGFLIVDDYSLAPCRKAVHEFRAAHGVTEEIVPVDLTAVHWRRAAP